MTNLKTQNQVLKKYFNVTVALPKNLPKGPIEADGLFLVPKWKKIGKTYNDAVVNVLEALKKDRPCYDWRDGNWSEKYLQQTSPRSIPEIVSAQMGKKYKGLSVEKVREIVPKSEILMGIYEIGIILLTNPKILAKFEDLWIDCPGDEYSPGAGSQFSWAPRFWFYGGRLEFGARDVGVTCEVYGSGSVFAPQLSIDPSPLDPLESLDPSQIVRPTKVELAPTEKGYIVEQLDRIEKKVDLALTMLDKLGKLLLKKKKR